MKVLSLTSFLSVTVNATHILNISIHYDNGEITARR